MKTYKHIVTRHPMSMGNRDIRNLEVKYIDVPHNEYVNMMKESYQPERLNEKTPKGDAKV